MIHITSQQVRQALADPLAEVVEAVHYTLERTPPDLSADIIDRGIVLTGGGALLRGIDRLIHEATSMPVRVADNPLDCVAVGAGLVLDNLDAMADALSEEDVPKYDQ
jgi:rod shape-determining protein MreB